MAVKSYRKGTLKWQRKKRENEDDDDVKKKKKIEALFNGGKNRMVTSQSTKYKHTHDSECNIARTELTIHIH